MRRALLVLLPLTVAALARAQDDTLRVTREVWLGDTIGGYARALAPSSDGRRVACVVDHGVEVREVATGDLVHELRLSGATSAAFSPDGRLLAVAGDRVIDAFDAATWRRVRSWEQEGASSIAFVSTDQLVWANERRVARGRARPRAPVERFDDEGGFTGLVAARSGQHVAAVDSSGRAVVWEVATGRRLHVFGGAEVVKVVLSPDGARLFCVGRDGARSAPDEPAVGALAAWDVRTGEPVSLPPRLATLRVVDVACADDRELVVLDEAPPARVRSLASYDLVTGAVTRRLRVGPSRRGWGIVGVTAVPGGPWVLGRSTHVLRWSLAGAGDATAQPGLGRETTALTFLPDDNLVVADRMEVACWDVASRSVRWRADLFGDFADRRDAPPLVACSRDGRWVAVVVDGAWFVRFLEVGTDRDVLFEENRRDPVRSLAPGTTPDGFTLGRRGRVLEVSPERQERVLHALTGLSPLQDQIACAPGVVLLAGGRARLRSFTDPALDLDLGVERATAAAITSDGRLAALGTEQGRVVVVDAVRGEHLWTVEGHDGPVHSLAFTGDGALVVAKGGESTFMSAWDVRTGASLGRLPLGPGRFVASPVGRRVAIRVGERVRIVDLED